MAARVVLVVLVAAIVGGATYAAMNGVWGESSQVISTRAGSPGGGFGVGGRGVK
ncbi:MAG: hypothetical protein LJE62_10470 [Silicimonas sp.]|jgi:hypothetical protein|nr:hypothetical protein [Silicimonas sp.]